VAPATPTLGRTDGRGAASLAVDLLALGAFRLAVSGLLLSNGFAAISDDDYARVVIAQRFIETPSLDPSGSSWLPLPFWLVGASMKLFGPGFATARGVALTEGVIAAWLVWLAARWLGANRPQALLAGLISVAFPYAAWLGAATVPESLTAGLTTLGATSLASTDGRRRIWGALALSLACLSRYEAWPAAAVFGCVCLWDAKRARRPALLAAACLGSAGCLAWLLHGVWTHGDATFFLTRVADYKAALGTDTTPASHRLLQVPRAVLFTEPEVTLGALALLVANNRVGNRDLVRRLRRPMLMVPATLVFLATGNLIGGTATHHPERALLSIWYLAAAALPLLAASWVRTRRARRPGPDLLLKPLGALIIFALCRGLALPRGQFTDRSAELALGQTARRIDSHGFLAVATLDYGYFAIIAGFASPARSHLLDSLDPRRAEAERLRDEASLLAALHASGATMLAYDTALISHRPGKELGFAAPSLSLVQLARVAPLR
jgi:hypothetical protein